MIIFSMSLVSINNDCQGIQIELKHALGIKRSPVHNFCDDIICRGIMLNVAGVQLVILYVHDSMFCCYWLHSACHIFDHCKEYNRENAFIREIS